MSFETEGFEFCKGLIPQKAIRQIKSNMVAVMRQFSPGLPDGPESLDRAFAEITRQGKTLRGNVLKLCSRMASVPLLLSEPKVAAAVRRLGIEVPAIQAYSIICMEPNEEKFLFAPHQDLKDRVNLNALILWFPLSPSDNEGGLGVFPGSHRVGPVKHGLSPAGHLQLPESAYAPYPRQEITRFSEGDCLFLSPYLMHWSVRTTGKDIRWTAVVKIDDALGTAHLKERLNPFVISEYIDERSNEARLAAAAKSEYSAG